MKPSKRIVEIATKLYAKNEGKKTPYEICVDAIIKFLDETYAISQ